MSGLVFWSFSAPCSPPPCVLCVLRVLSGSSTSKVHSALFGDAIFPGELTAGPNHSGRPLARAGMARSLASMTIVRIPEQALVVLVGPAGCGKSSFALRHFRSTEVVSSDRCRELVADDARDQRSSPAAFRVLQVLVAERLRLGRLTVVDATNLHGSARRQLLRHARAWSRPAVAVLLDVTEERCLAQNRARRERRVPDDVVRRQHAQLAAAKRDVLSEEFDDVVVITDPASIDEVERYRARIEGRDGARRNPP
jgi:predicted kinase